MPYLLKVFVSDNFSNRIGETSLNNVHQGPTELPIMSLSELIIIQRQDENIVKSKTGLKNSFSSYFQSICIICVMVTRSK